MTGNRFSSTPSAISATARFNCSRIANKDQYYQLSLPPLRLTRSQTKSESVGRVGRLVSSLRAGTRVR